MMSSVSPLHPIGKLANPGSSGNFFGLGPSSVTNTGATLSSSPPTLSTTVNCIGVNLSPSSSTVSSSCSLSSSTLTITSLTTSTSTTTTSSLSNNSIVNLISCSTPLPSLQNSPASTIDSVNHLSNSINSTDENKIKSNGEDDLKANVPFSWKREKINGSIVYISPSNCFLWSHQDITDYLLTEGTCKCGLECPIILENVFNFDSSYPSINFKPVSNQSHTINCKILTKDKNSKNETNQTLHNNNPINGDCSPKNCNHRRRHLIRDSENHQNQATNLNVNDSNFSISSSNTSTTVTTTSVNDTSNQINVRSTQLSSAIPEATNQPLQQQPFTNPNHVHQVPNFQHLNHQQQQSQQLTTNSIQFYPSSHHQSIMSPGVTIFRSDANFNLTQDKEPTPAPTSSSSSYTSDPHLIHSNISKDFQHHSNPSPLTANSYINWLPLNASNENRITAIVNENQSNVQTFANTSSPSLPGFADVLSGMSLAPTLIDPHNPRGGQLVQLYNPVQYSSVPPNAVALLSPAQNLSRDGSATILIPSLMQSTDHHHHHHQQQQQQQTIVLNSPDNVSTSTLDHPTRTILPSIRSTTFPSIPLQSPYAFQPQLADAYSAASSPSPTHSYTVNPTNINNSGSINNNSDNSNRIKSKSKSKAKLIKRRSPRNLKSKENSQRLNQTSTVTSYFNQKQREPEKFVDQVIDEKESIDVDESSSRSQSINDHLINEFEDEEPMNSQDCDYEANSFITQSENDKGNFEYERIDDSAQCTSEDIMRELSSHQNSMIRNVGVQSDEMIGDPVSPVKSLPSNDCSNEMIYSANNHLDNTKNVTEDDIEDIMDEDEIDDDDYSIHSNIPDDSEGSSEKDDKMDNLKTTCEFVLQDDDINSDSFNELDDDVAHDDEDEFDLDGNTNDNDLLSSDDLSVNFVNSDNNNNINSDVNSFDDEDEFEDDHNRVNYDNQNTIISLESTMTTNTSLSKLANQAHNPDEECDDNYGEVKEEEEDEDKEDEENNDDKITMHTIINQSSAVGKPADEGLYGRLSNSNKATTNVDEDGTKNRNNKRLERLRKELLCYENNFDQTTAQSPPLSPQVRTFETGDLVWGQMRGNPSWPGKLITKDDVPGANIGQAERGKVWVKWFGDNLVTQVELDKLKTLSEGLEAHHTARKKHRKGKKTDSCLDQAIQEAMMELDKQMEQQSSIPSTMTTSKSHPPTSSAPPSQPPPSSSSSAS